MKPRRSVKKIMDSLSRFSEDFMEERNQPPLQERASLQWEKKNNAQLPEGWVIKPIGEVCQFEKGKKPKNTGNRSDARTIPYINIKAFESGMPEEYAEQGNCPICSKDDVLIVWDGARSGLIGKGVSGYIGSTLSKVWSELTDDKYLFYFLKSQYGYINTNTKGVGIPHVDPNILYAIQLPIAPFPIQKLIVSEIEKQFSRLDKAVAALKRVQTSLKRYKAAVLKAAVEGKLTEDWRKQNPDVEPADKLLKRILAERKKKWEEKNPKKKYKEPSAPDTSNLPELPKGWTWSNLAQLAEASPNALKAGPFGSSLKKSYYVPKGYKIYGQEQVLRDDPHYGDYYIDEKRYKMLESCAVKAGDILISLVGTIGRILILPDKIEPGIINPRLVKVSLDRRLINAKFIKRYLQSPYVKHLFSLASHGGTMDILNLTILKEVPIPLPPREEQNNAIEEIERQFSVDDEIETAVETNLKRAERLRQAILKKAFSGRLVLSKQGVFRGNI